MYKVIITCEHASNKIPVKYNKLFDGKTKLLNTHQGYDIGAISVAKKLKLFSDYYQAATFSRLLIDLNRSAHHANLFSEMTMILSKDIKNHILQTYYDPYRNKIESAMENFYKKNHKLFHLSVHSFTPQLPSKAPRNCDIAILYDPKRKSEKQIAFQWKQIFLQIDPTLKVRFNYPYLGTADGFVTWLRKKYKKNYVGIELEINQKLFLHKNASRQRLMNTLQNSLQALIEQIS